MENQDKKVELFESYTATEIKDRRELFSSSDIYDLSRDCS